MDHDFTDRSQKVIKSHFSSFYDISKNYVKLLKDIWFYKGSETVFLTVLTLFGDMPDLVGIWCRKSHKIRHISGIKQ